MSNDKVIIDYFTDVLCVWAWISQRRIDELRAKLGDRIEIRSQFVDIFGDTATKIATQWGERGGYVGFAAHTASAAEPYDLAPVNPRIWTEVRPASSGMAHLFVKATELAYDADTADMLTLQLRRAFFVDARDVSDVDVLEGLASELDLRVDDIRRNVRDGNAMAALLGDYRRATSLGVNGSPVFLMNQNRQMLYGNVGYRVLQANVEELLRRPATEASWC
jgi:predicted DsbA family dithiol-disulfide isomerase